MTKLTENTVVSMSITVVAVLFLGMAFASATALPAPDFSSVHPPYSTGVSADTVPLPGEGPLLTLVHIDPETAPAVKIAVQACAGLCNRKRGGSVFTHMDHKDLQWIEELALQPDRTLTAGEFLDACKAEFPRWVKYSYDKQRALLPNILTVGAVLEAIPIAEEMNIQWGKLVFDATAEFRERDTPYLATKYVYENYVNDTTGLAMLNPGYKVDARNVWDPGLSGSMNPSMIDFVFSEKLFVMFLVNGCITCTREHDLLNEIVSVNPWPKPIGVYGYANNWMVFGGYLFEAQTLCAASRNMGAIPTEVNNLSFFSTRREPITDPDEIPQNKLEVVHYDPAKTYVALILGDGDNIAFMMGMRIEWFRQRAAACRAGDDSCPPLTWTISPHLARIAPDVLTWYYKMSRDTGNDYFMLPPSGHLYAYPSSLESTTMQDKFVVATEQDARLIGSNSTVHWEFFHNWRYTEDEFLPKYAKEGGTIKGVFPVNVPYLLPTGTWLPNQFFKVIAGQDGGKVVLFRPREWRGVNDKGGLMEEKFFLSPEKMAKELGSYPRGTVTGIYMTSDGGLNLNNSIMELVKILPEHVRLVSADTAVHLALEAPQTQYRREYTLPAPLFMLINAIIAFVPALFYFKLHRFLRVVLHLLIPILIGCVAYCFLAPRNFEAYPWTLLLIPFSSVPGVTGSLLGSLVSWSVRICKHRLVRS
ncbi:MAG TPA: hypothetical protein PLI09_01115 [Candidatus Hydrogenedentes bacterium]|nr:hypothetical protein [Candidatus Hydrogenedentota bacterium]